MRIGINALTDFSGGAVVHLKNVLKYWAENDRQNEYYIFTTSQNLNKLGKVETDNFHYRLFKVPALSMFARLVWEQIVFPFHLKRAGVDILFCPSNFGPIFSLPKTVLMIQNIAPFFENIIINEVSYYNKNRLRMLAILIKISSRNADIVIFPSRYSQELLVNIFNISEKKTVVIYHGKDKSFRPIADKITRNQIREKMGIKNNFIFCVAHIYRYKNLKELLEAFVRVRNTVDNSIQLLIAGRIYDQQYISEMSTVINKYGLQEAVIIKRGKSAIMSQSS